MDNNILRALDHIPPDIDRETWYRILAALKAELGDAGAEVAEDWSKGATSYKAADFQSTWKSLNGSGGISIGTLFHIAKGYGYRPEATAEPAKEAHEDTQRLVALKCVERWRKAAPANPEHPYLKAKQVQAHGIKQEGDNLLIPLQDSDGNLWSLQTIAPDGKKLFATGGRAKGMYFRIKGKGPAVVCEGYGTGSSLAEATGYPVAIAFFCGNLESVARTIRGKLPDARIIIAADSAPEKTTAKARKAAQAIGADLAIPSIESDFNDLHRAEGLEAVRVQIEAAAPVPAEKPAGWQAPGPITGEEWRMSRLAPACIVENYLFADVAVKIAPGGTGKTTLQLFEAIHIALGRPLYGLEIHKPGPVVILTAEDSREMLIARLRRIAEALALRPAEIEHIQRQVRIDDLCGAGIRLTEIIGDVVRPAAFVDTLAERLADLAPVLVTIDPAVSFGVGESRVNDAEQGLVEAARRLRKALNCCARYVHHSGKQNAREKTTDQYTGRGGSAFADGARMVHVLQPLDATGWHKATGTDLEPGESGLILARPKMSYCPPQGDILLRRRGYLFEHIDCINADPVATLRRDADTLLALIPTLVYPTQNTLEMIDTGLGRNRTRAVVRYLIDTGLVESRKNPKHGGAQQYLHVVGSGNGAPTAAPTSPVKDAPPTENGSSCAAAYRERGGGAPTAAPSPSDPKVRRRQGGAPTAHLAHLDGEPWEDEL